ncbi:hypothetical protein evm_015393, partial [Chilo suppressalis]
MITSYGRVATKPKANKKDRRVLLPTDGEYSIDPLECCDMDDFIASSSRSECGFHLSWDGSKRFKINEQNLAPTTTVLPETTSTPVNKDIRIVPLPLLTGLLPCTVFFVSLRCFGTVASAISLAFVVGACNSAKISETHKKQGT